MLLPTYIVLEVQEEEIIQVAMVTLHRLVHHKEIQQELEEVFRVMEEEEEVELEEQDQMDLLVQEQEEGLE